MTTRDRRIAALEAAQKADIERQNGGPFEPRGLEGQEIATKLVGHQLVADLEDEFFGGFQASKAFDEPTDDVWRRVGKGRFFRRIEPSPWGRIWVSVDITVERFGRSVPLQRVSRGWATERPTNGPHPFVLQAVQQVEQWLPEVTPELDRARELEDLERRLALLERKTDPKGGSESWDTSPSLSGALRRTMRVPGDSFFARGVLREEKQTLVGHVTERRIQRHLCRRYKPSRALEEKRFLKLPRVEMKLVPKGNGAAKADLRAELEQLTALFTGDVQVCPAETTTAMLNRRSVGRPRKHADDAAKQKAYRDAKKARETLEQEIRIFEGDNSATERAGDRRESRCDPVRVDRARASNPVAKATGPF